MSYLGAGLLVGAATAVTKKLSNKEKKEEARYAFLKEAIDKGISEFETGKSEATANANYVYNKAEEWVQSSGLITDIAKQTDNNTYVYQGTMDILESLGVPVYARDASNKIQLDNNGNKQFNTKLTTDPNLRLKLNDGLTKIATSKLLSAQRDANFDIGNDNHVSAILAANVGGDSRFKPSILLDGPQGQVVNKNIVNDGFNLGLYAEPVTTEKVGLGKRISNFFNAADDDELVRRLAKEENISIEDAKRLVRAGQTEEKDAFTGTLKENIGSLYGDLPDITVQNLFTLIPTDADTIPKIEAAITKQLANETLDNAVYIDSNLSDNRSHINFDPVTKTFKDKNNKAISNSDLVEFYTNFRKDTATGDLTNLLPSFESTDTRYKNDATNMTDYFAEIATTYSTAKGEGYADIKNISQSLKARGYPELDQVVNERDLVKRVNDILDAKGLKYNNTLTAFRFTKTQTVDQRMNMSEHIYGITQILQQYSVPSDRIIPLTHIILAEQFKGNYADKMSGLSDPDAK